jgi:hypothetical protein
MLSIQPIVGLAGMDDRNLGHWHANAPRLPLEVLAVRAVIVAGAEATILEICALSRKDRDRFFQAFRSALYRHHGPYGKPRFTLVSDGNPRRRLLLGREVSYSSNSNFTVVLLCCELTPVTSR